MSGYRSTIHNFTNLCTKFLDGVERIFYWIVCSLLFSLLTVTVGGIVFDMVLAISLPWVEEMLILLFGWVIFLGVGIIMRVHGHVGVGALVRLVPKKFQLMFYFFNLTLIMMAALVMIYFGIKITIFSGLRQTSIYLDIPFSYYYAAVPLGGILLALFTFEAFFLHKYGRQKMFTSPDD
jgi:TRAP-type C4-dicarboxylate transport system permease small subunit